MNRRLRLPDTRTLVVILLSVGALLLLGILIAVGISAARDPEAAAGGVPSGAMDLVRPIRASDIIVPPLGLGRPEGDVYFYSEPDVPWSTERVEALRIDTDAISSDILREMNEALLREILDVPPP
ncbi:MAG: hypothetical protein ACOC4F_02335 [bacterium]